MERKPDLARKPRRVVLLRWELVATVFVMVLVLAAASIPGWSAFTSPAQIFVYGSLILLAVFILYITLFRWRTLETRLTDVESQLERTKRRLGQLIRLGEELATIESEDRAVEVGLEACLAVAAVTGISGLPFDERGYARPVLWRGDLNEETIRSLADYLALPAMRAHCTGCEVADPAGLAVCPFSLPRGAGIQTVLCVHVRRKEKTICLVHLYLKEGEELDSEAEAFLSAMTDELAAVIEALRLRQKDLGSERLLQNRIAVESTDILATIAEACYRLSHAEFLLVSREVTNSGEPLVKYSFGIVPSGDEDKVLNLLAVSSLRESRDAEVRLIPSQRAASDYRLYVSSPLLSPDGLLLGGFAIGWRTEDRPVERAISEARLIAECLSVLAGHLDRLQEVEFRTVMGERKRLAREIHDGLAQSLGYLKLLSARMSGYLDTRDEERLSGILSATRAALDETYEDARTAIDDLKSTPETGLSGWLEQAGHDFQETSGMRLILQGSALRAEPAPEVQLQLMRIVQEALTNVRKHSAAGQVWLEWHQKGRLLEIEIRDDGLGFRPEALLTPTRHGLLSMQERAELIGAELSIISSDSEGTIVRLRLPLPILETEA